MSNIQTIQSIYAAFATGDIPAILGRLSEAVEWDCGMPDAGVPWLKPRRGRAEVSKFFESLAALDLLKFQPKTFLEGGNMVVSLIDGAFVVKATGRKIVEEDEVHIWRFDDHGRVTQFCHKLDTHQHWAAFRGEDSGSAR